MKRRSEVALIHLLKSEGSVCLSWLLGDSLGNSCCYCNFPGRGKDILKRQLFLFLTVKLLKQQSPRSWNFPRGLMLREEKAQAWYQPERELLFQKQVWHHSQICQTILRKKLELDTEGSMTGETTTGPELLLHLSCSLFNLNLKS